MHIMQNLWELFPIPIEAELHEEVFHMHKMWENVYLACPFFPFLLFQSQLHEAIFYIFYMHKMWETLYLYPSASVSSWAPTCGKVFKPWIEFSAVMHHWFAVAWNNLLHSQNVTKHLSRPIYCCISVRLKFKIIFKEHNQKIWFRLSKMWKRNELKYQYQTLTLWVM